MLNVVFLYVFVLFAVLFSIVITSLGEERAGLYASHAFVVFILSALLSVFLCLGVSGRLRLVTVALAGLFV